MKNNKKIQREFEQFLDNLDEQNYYMLEDEIDINIQNKYFSRSREIEKKYNKEEVFSHIHILNDVESDIDSKKDLLVQLASLRDVEAFRLLEKCHKGFNNEELNIWSTLAYNESKMLLNGSLKNEQQVFISTGLGGKNGKFRYFVALLPNEDLEEGFSDFQRQFVKKELQFTLEQQKAELEETIEDHNKYLSFKLLIPIKTNIPKLFKTILDNCNQLATFVSEKFIITNVNLMDREEIEEFIDNIDEDDETIVEDIVSLN